MTTEQKRGLMVMVYRPADPYYGTAISSAIITARAVEVLLLLPDSSGPLTQTDAPGVPMMRLIPGKRPRAIPADVSGDGAGRWAFGGCFLFSTDSRFAGIDGGRPIPCHDYDMSAERR